MTATARKTTSLHSCACSTFEFGTFDPETGEDTTFTTGCDAQTKRVFAQGHDAKLVGFLVRAELAGIEISQTEGGLKSTFASSITAAVRISDALAEKARVQLDAAIRREGKKAAAANHRQARAAGKTQRAEAKVEVPATRAARIKVGRWEYDAVIGAVTGDAVYKTKLGQMKSAKPGEYREV